LNALWTPLFFGLHRSGLAFADIVLLWLVLATTLGSFWQVRQAAGGFAGALSGLGDLCGRAELHPLAA